MIFSLDQLQGIKSGTITLAFRKWKKASVKKGSVLTTAICRIGIDDVSIVEESDITNKDAIKAGFENKEALGQYPGDIYKIKLRYHSEDPRIAMREQKLTDEMFGALRKKMERLDKSSEEGAWTKPVLQAIDDHPLLRAADLCKIVGMEKMKMKLNIRKLKNLGLTISHEVGYDISPLGKEFLNRIRIADKG
jgi:hypothetical protein